MYFWNGRSIAGRRENSDRLLPHFRRGMTEQSAYSRVRSSLLFHFKKRECVKNFLGIGTGKIDGQKIGRRSVQDRGAGLLDIQAMLANGFLQSSDVMPSGDGYGYEPCANEKQCSPTDVACRYMQIGGQNQGSHTGQTVA